MTGSKWKGKIFFLTFWTFYSGFIRTPFHGTNFGEGYQDVVDYCVSQHPLGHIGSTEDCVNAIAFFIKESASFVTGSILLVDGGLGRKAAF